MASLPPIYASMLDLVYFSGFTPSAAHTARDRHLCAGTPQRCPPYLETAGSLWHLQGGPNEMRRVSSLASQTLALCRLWHRALWMLFVQQSWRTGMLLSRSRAVPSYAPRTAQQRDRATFSGADYVPHAGERMPGIHRRSYRAARAGCQCHRPSRKQHTSRRRVTTKEIVCERSGIPVCLSCNSTL